MSPLLHDPFNYRHRRAAMLSVTNGEAAYRPVTLSYRDASIAERSSAQQ